MRTSFRAGQLSILAALIPLIVEAIATNGSHDLRWPHWFVTFAAVAAVVISAAAKFHSTNHTRLHRWVSAYFFTAIGFVVGGSSLMASTVNPPLSSLLPPHHLVAWIAAPVGFGMSLAVTSGATIRTPIPWTAGCAGIACGFLQLWIIVSPAVFFPGTLETLIGIVFFGAVLLFHVSYWGQLLPSLKRLNHAFPHVVIAMCGLRIAGTALDVGWAETLWILGTFYLLLIQNDFFDRKEDELAARETVVTAEIRRIAEMIFIGAVLFLYLMSPLRALSLGSIALLGLLYHHPAIRLKTRFCFPYIIEGGWTALAFTFGVGESIGETIAPISAWVWLFFGGGALFSMVKDWKDVTSDRLAGIWTIYVTLSKRMEEPKVHLIVTVACAAGLLCLFLSMGFRGEILATATIGCGTLAFLSAGWLIDDKNRSTEWMLNSITLSLVGVLIGI